MVEYSEIFLIFIDLLKTAIPISIFLWLAKVMINYFFSLAIPKKFRGDIQ